MTTDTNRDNLIVAMDALNMADEIAASRLGVAVGVIRGVRAGKLWERRIPEPPAFAATKIIEEAEHNGVQDDPIELPQGDGADSAVVETDGDSSGEIKADEPPEGSNAKETLGADESAEALKTIEAAAEGPRYTTEGRLAAADDLQKTDTLQAIELIRDAILAGDDDLAAGQLQDKIGKKLGRSAAQMTAHWAQYVAEIARAKAKLHAVAHAPGDQRPRLEIQEGHPDRTVSDLRDIHAASGRIFERGGAPVRIVYDKDSDGSVAYPLTGHGLILETHFVCQPWKIDRRGVERHVDLPATHAQMYLAWKGERNLPPLNGVTTAPILSADGSIRTASGYDVQTGLFCERVPDVAPLVPVNPTRAEAAAALLLVRNVVKTFPFKDAITCTVDGVRMVILDEPPRLDESSFLASLLGAVCRPSLWLAPGSLFEGAKASGSGVGKGLLVRIVCVIAYGRQPIAIGPGGNNEELEKRISAAFLQGGPMIFLDNFNDITLESSALESALTERPSQVRQFGTLEMVAINALASVFITGNATGLGHDSARRFVRTQFDAGVEDAEGRKFSGDIQAEVMATRPTILAALLTIWRYGRLAADIKRGLPLGSYEQWGEWVRDPLLRLGCRDPVERLSDTKALDPERQKIAELYLQWWKVYQSAAKPAFDVTDYEIGRIINPQNRERQFVAAALGKIVGSRVAGFVMTRQAPAGHHGRATFALEKTENMTGGEAAKSPIGCTTEQGMPPMVWYDSSGLDVQKKAGSEKEGKKPILKVPTDPTPENHTIPWGAYHGNSQKELVNNATTKILPSRNFGKTGSPDSSGGRPNDATIPGGEPPPEPPAAEPLSEALDGGPPDPIPESLRKLEREARAAMAEVAARAAAAAAAGAGKEQPTTKRRKPK
jgi:hypothetical protein